MVNSFYRGHSLFFYLIKYTEMSRKRDTKFGISVSDNEVLWNEINRFMWLRKLNTLTIVSSISEHKENADEIQWFSSSINVIHCASEEAQKLYSCHLKKSLSIGVWTLGLRLISCVAWNYLIKNFSIFHFFIYEIVVTMPFW